LIIYIFTLITHILPQLQRWKPLSQPYFQVESIMLAINVRNGPKDAAIASRIHRHSESWTKLRRSQVAQRALAAQEAKMQAAKDAES